MNVELLLETLVESLRHHRRYGPKYPTPYDLSRILYNVEAQRIELDLLEDGQVVKYDVLIDRVTDHGGESIPS